MRISDWSSDVCSSDLRFRAHLVEQMLDKVGEKGRLALELFHQGAAAHAGALGDRERTRAGISRLVQALDRGGEHPATRVLTPDAMRAARSPPEIGRWARFAVYYILARKSVGKGRGGLVRVDLG